MKKELVKVWERQSQCNGQFTYYLVYSDLNGKRRMQSLGHHDERKAQRERAQLEAKLYNGYFRNKTMRLSELLTDCIERTKLQVRENTLCEYKSAMKSFIECAGDIDSSTVRHEHAEKYVQYCIQKNAPATVRKKLMTLKRIFQMAIERDQLESNPFSRVKTPKFSAQPVRVLTAAESNRLLAAAKVFEKAVNLKWHLLITIALHTGLRRGEVLNVTWNDIDWDKKLLKVTPKKDTALTWKWDIKDTDNRLLPLTDELLAMLKKHKLESDSHCPYVFIPHGRYNLIQAKRAEGKWSLRKGANPLNNFVRPFRSICRRAGVENASFHDLRRTCLTNWFANDLREFEVMNLAGHANFETTRKFYLAVRTDLLDRARAATEKSVKAISVANLLQSQSGSTTSTTEVNVSAA